MRRIVYCSVWFTAIVCSSFAELVCGADEAKSDIPSISDLLPVDGTEVDVMGFPERFAELSRKLQAGMKENPGALLVEVLKAKPGEPIAYDPRFGLTKEEFDEYLRLANELKLVKVASVTLKVQRANGEVHVDGGELLPALKEIRFKPDEKQVRTPFGDCTKPMEVRASDGQTATGRWNGVEWKLEKLLPPTDVSVRLGKLEDSGRGLLIYRAKGFEGLKPKSVAYVLIYDLPAAK